MTGEDARVARSAPEEEWHAREVDAVYDALDSGPAGLSTAEAERRLAAYGPNELTETEGVSPLSLFLAQFRETLIYVLVLAAVLSLAVGLLPGVEPNYVDAALILAILLGNGVFGFVQDYRAEQSIAALRRLATPDATVVRDGVKRTVDATAVVPGDVVVLEGGDAVPADARLVETTDLKADEAALTGESGPVEKETDPLDPDTALADRRNLAFMHTNVVHGRGRAVVVATGMETAVGDIATQLATTEDVETPFQREIDRLGRRIGYGVVGLIALVAAVQFLATGADALTVLLTGATLAVAAVPEGLPAVVTLTLALGSRKLLARNALVRRLPVVESLGAVDTIVTDKTGTLTESRMTVRRLSLGGVEYEVVGTGRDRGAGAEATATDGNPGASTVAEASADSPFRRNGDPVDPAVLEALLRCGAVCNDAEPDPESGDGEYRGDPTEVALLVAAARAGVSAEHDRRREIPFSSERKRMTVVADDPPTAYTKGAPEVVLARCDRIRVDGEVRPLTDDDRAAVLARVESFGADALRVLGFAVREGVDPSADPETIESGLTFLGLQGMLDPPRREVPDAVADCRRAGIRVVMATGDNLTTARAVGESIGFDPTGALDGPALDRMDEDDLAAAVESVDVFARVAPDHKVRILRALQRNGHTVAMTGDGVNDAPALRSADVGVAMGVRGTDVAQQAADVVLRDDNFATIRDAIAEGRAIFDNVRKFVNYLLSANAGEVLVVFVGVLLGTALFPTLFAGDAGALVLTPVMLLWVNMVTDGLPALALGVDPPADGVLDRPPRPATAPVLGRRMLASIVGVGLVTTVTGLALFFHALAQTGSVVRAQTLLFTFVVSVEMVRIQVIRSRYHQSPVSNRWLVAAVAVSFALQLAVLYTPLAGLFGVVAPSIQGWTWIAAAFVAFVASTLAVEWVADRLV